MSTYKYRQWQFPLMLRIAACQDTLAKGSLCRDQLIERKQTGLNSDLSQNLKSKYNSKGSERVQLEYEWFRFLRLFGLSPGKIL